MKVGYIYRTGQQPQEGRTPVRMARLLGWLHKFQLWKLLPPPALILDKTKLNFSGTCPQLLQLHHQGGDEHLSEISLAPFLPHIFPDILLSPYIQLLISPVGNIPISLLECHWWYIFDLYAYCVYLTVTFMRWRCMADWGPIIGPHGVHWMTVTVDDWQLCMEYACRT